MKEREKYGVLEPGSAVATSAFDLSAKIVIHAVSRPWRGGSEGEEDVLRECYRNSLKLAEKKNAEASHFLCLGHMDSQRRGHWKLLWNPSGNGMLCRHMILKYS